MSDPIKDLQQLRSLFPEMESYTPDPEEAQHEPKKPELSAAEKSAMKLYVSRDKKHRGGKQVTLIQGHEGPEEVRQQLLSALKSLCSAGGSHKEGELILQGDHVKKVIGYLIRDGYKQTKQKGG